MRLMVKYFQGVVVVSALVTVAACSPKYPKCETDEHCQEKNEVCLNGSCQECREDEQCTAKRGEGFTCMNGRCEQKPECRTDTDCTKIGEGLICRAQKCVPECTAATDCASGKKCENNRCVAECEVDIDCGPDRLCQAGRCQDKPREEQRISAGCRPIRGGSAGDIIAAPTVRFEFDQFDLTVATRSSLDQTANCMKEVPTVKVVIEGHADERGTQEYNLALGEKRAAAVRTYLRNLGIDERRMVLRSKGENEPECTESSESCWAKNRRVLFIQNTR